METKRALLNEWLWHFGIDHQALWRSVIAAKYGEKRNGCKNKDPVRSLGCGLWKGINKGVESFFKYTRFKVNSDERVLS